MSEHAPEHTLPRLVDARKLVTTEAHFQRPVAGADLQRLGECSEEIVDVKVDIRFGRDEQGRPILSGKLSANLQLECQRCLEAMPFETSKEILLALVWDDEQGKALPKYIEPWVVGEGEVDLIEIIEEEILLALPVAPKHEHDCLDLSSIDTEPELEEDEKKHNPFSVLADLNIKKPQ